MNNFIKLKLKKKHSNDGRFRIIGPRCIGYTNVYMQPYLDSYVKKFNHPLSTIQNSYKTNGYWFSLDKYVYNTYNKNKNSVRLDINVVLNGYSVKPLTHLFKSQVQLPIYRLAKGIKIDYGYTVRG